MREALWSAVACYRFHSGQLAGRGAVYSSWESEAASKLEGSKRQQAAALQGGLRPQMRPLACTQRAISFIL